MYVEKIRLTNFRNHKELEIYPTPKINVFYGDNAQGKTNILEALYFAACGKSHRTNKDKELIGWGAQEFIINTQIKKNQEDIKIDILVDNEHKSIKINDTPIKRMGELMGTLMAVMFSPEDLKLIKEGPIEKRRFIDIACSQVKPNYFYNLQQYIKIIHHRNALLRESKNNKALLQTMFVWDNKLVEIGTKIMYYRNEYINKISFFAKTIHKKLSGEDLEIKYLPSIGFCFEDIDDLKEIMGKELEKNIEKDLRFGTTSVGPHRDTFDVFINGTNSKTYGSQGQQRTAALSLKLAEVEFFLKELGEYPILLLDDVLSELDEKRQRFLLENLDNVQTFLTCTNKFELDKKGAFFSVSGGTVQQA